MLNGNHFMSLSRVVNMANAYGRRKLEINGNDIHATKQMLRQSVPIKTETQQTSDYKISERHEISIENAIVATPERSLAGYITNIINNLRDQVFCQSILEDQDNNLHELEIRYCDMRKTNATKYVYTGVSELQTNIDNFTSLTSKSIDTEGIDFSNLLSTGIDDAMDTLISLYNRIADISDGDIMAIKNKNTDYRISYDLELGQINKQLLAEYDVLKEKLYTATKKAENNNEFVVDFSASSSRTYNIDTGQKEWNLLNIRV